MSEILEVKEEKNITVQTDKHGGSTFKASYNLSEKHVLLQIQNGSDPAALIPITHDTILKLAAWLDKRAGDIETS